MLGLLLIALAITTAALVAISARFSSLVTTLLVTYLAYVANLGIVVLVLSPFEQVNRAGLAIAEGVLLVAALAFWWLRGRPAPPLTAARAAARQILTDPVCLAFIGVVLALLAYQALLATAPPNNMDSLTYHLSRAAAWAQHGGWYWIPNAPEVPMTAYQPFAEQQILFLFVATGDGALYALPQYLGELTLLVAIYGSARRLGFEVRPSACAAFLVATFSFVALESMTAQNDLFAASLVAVATCLLLARARFEAALAGAALGINFGTKLTVGLTAPILVALALVIGRRFLGWAVVGSVVGFLTIGVWGYMMNHHVTGLWLGEGTEGVQNRASPEYPESLRNAFLLMYGLMDGSVMSSRLIHILALVGIAVGVGCGAWALWRVGRRRALRDGTMSALPFLAPILVIAGAGAVDRLSSAWGMPLRGPDGFLVPTTTILNMEYGRIANENYSAYGPIGVVAMLAAIGLTVADYARRRVDARHLVLACAVPVFLILVAISTWWVPFLLRFFLLPTAIAAPLLARLFSSRVTTAAYLVAASIAIGVTITHLQPKPLDNPYGLGRPWNLTQENALRTNSTYYVADALVPLRALVPPTACVGAVLSPNEPAYLLYGPNHEHKVVYLDPGTAVEQALAHGLWHIVLTTRAFTPWLADSFRGAGWKVEPLGSYWLLASQPGGGDGTC